MTVKQLIEELRRLPVDEGDTEVITDGGDDVTGARVKVYSDGGRLVILS